LLNGQNTLPSKDKKESYSPDLKSPQQLLSSQEPYKKIKQKSSSNSCPNIPQKIINKRKKDLLNKLNLKLKVIILLNLEKTVEKTRPFHLKFGLNHVTKLI
jgi:hypothetical protein